jgi:hypothetical protein
MEQRRLRLGDILDDYCPRERRVTNHAVVAMIEEAVKQTRCTTCDAEHAYKGAKVPRKRKQETPAALYREVLAGLPENEGAPVLAAPPAPDMAVPQEVALDEADAGAEDAPEPLGAEDARAVSDDDLREDTRDDEYDAPPPAAEEGPVHRPLIRATLPRPEGQKEERRMPEFTIRHNAGRGNGPHHRGGDMRGKARGFGGGGNGNGSGNGNRAHGGPRFAGARPAGPGGRGPGRGAQPSGFRSGQPPRHGGRKRSR